MPLLLDPNIKMSLLRIFFNIGLPFSEHQTRYYQTMEANSITKNKQNMSENLNIEIMTTAAWSNGVCERHNAVIGDMVTRIVAETKCPLEIALAWAVNAKNSLHNVYGYSPNQLVFGRNPNLPSVINDKPPALEGTTSSEVVAKNLNEARKAFIENEASEKLRRALRHKIRPTTSIIYQPGENNF